MNQGRADNVSATMRRWELAARLRQYREATGMTHTKVAEALQKGPGRWSQSKISRIENREHNLKPAELERLLDVYGVTDQDTRLELHEIAAKANERGWWLAYRGTVPDRIHPLIELESAMVGLRDFATMLVPGLLQTSDYARALISGISPHFDPHEVELRVAGRMARQQVFGRQPPPQIHVVMHHVLLEQEVGSPEVMRIQLRRLIKAAESPNITIQVLPKMVGVHPGMDGPFMVVSLPEPITDVGYTEGPGGCLYIEDRERVLRLTTRFETLAQLALPAGDSVELIAKAARDYESSDQRREPP